MEPRVRSIEIDGQLTLPYVELGDPSGVPVILLHGYTDSWRSFERVLPYLPQSIRALALTQRGHGDAGRPASGYGVRDFAGDVLAFMETVRLGMAVIAGGSSGGFVARRFAIDHADRTLGLVLAGTPLKLRDKAMALEMWDTISGLTDPIDPRFVREFVKSTYARPVPESFVEILVEESLKVPARVWKATLAGLLEDDSSEEINKITAPTLMIWGDRDAIVPRTDQEVYARDIRNSRALVYSGTGHAVYYEEPARFASDLSDFIAERTRSGA